MTRALIQFTVFIGIFMGSWLLLSQINFMEDFGVQQLSDANEKKLGEVILEFIKKSDREIKTDSVVSVIEGMKDRLCKKNDIDPAKVKIHILYNSEVNAFALPDNHMVIYTGLIEDSKNPEEVCGVMAHELAHMEHNHVMKKMAKEVGISVMLALAGGDSGSEILKEAVQLVTSSSFDRSQESEADATAVKLMAKADVDPRYLADFLFRISVNGGNIPKQLEWISTHPDSKDRAGEVLKLRKFESYKSTPITDSTSWAGVKQMVRWEE